MPKAKRKREAPALPPNATITPAFTFTLAHISRRSQYDFRPRGEEVVVEFSTAKERRSYALPLDEARDLWRKLKSEGYERF